MFNVATEQTQSWPTHTSNTKVYFNKFVGNALRDNIESKKNQPLAPEKNMKPFFSFLIIKNLGSN